MGCGMCEAHINNEIRKNFDVKKVKSRRRKNETIIVSKNELDEKRIKEVIDETGYELKGIERKEK